MQQIVTKCIAAAVVIGGVVAASGAAQAHHAKWHRHWRHAEQAAYLPYSYAITRSTAIRCSAIAIWSSSIRRTGPISSASARRAEPARHCNGRACAGAARLCRRATSFVVLWRLI